MHAMILFTNPTITLRSGARNTDWAWDIVAHGPLMIHTGTHVRKSGAGGMIFVTGTL